MATLEAGVRYGLRSNINVNKNVLFVKLTDSAQRHAMNYFKNRHLISQKPTIQFLGNEGRLCFPSLDCHEDAFTFSLSSNQDIEGPSGGFECIHQTGSKSLESLGNIPCKVRIHANDDVYETTRHRMVIAEENSKNKCTRVIKAGGLNIGRKVKVTGTGRTIPPPSNVKHRESSISNSQPRRSPSYKPAVSNPPEKKIPDIMRRPLKERLIHLLALRPFKKPELYDRLNKEGLRDRERPIMMSLLRMVAFMRDNTYHLQRHIWNDVQEDWPFYTEQEKAILRRRKPQNLTPPGSSDGSTGSGQSPNSIQPGSPPAITAPPPSLLSNKRPGYYQGNDGLPTKKQRVSHYRKSDANSCPINANENGRTGSGVSASGVSPNAGNTISSGNSASGAGGSNSNSGNVSGWDQKKQQHHHYHHHHQQQQQPQQQQRERRSDNRPERTANSDVLRGGNGHASVASGSKLYQVSSSDNANNQSAYGRESSGTAMTGGNAGNSLLNTMPSSHNSHSSPAYSNSMNGSGVGGSSDRHYLASKSASVVAGDNSARGANNVTRPVSCSARSDSALDVGTSNNSSRMNAAEERRRERSDRSRTSSSKEERDRKSSRNSANVASSCNDNVDNTVNTLNRDLPIIIEENLEQNPQSLMSAQASTYRPESPRAWEASENSQTPTYLTYFTTITSREQRRRYQSAFSSKYEEYRKLHAQVDAITKRFSQFSEQLDHQTKLGNSIECEKIQQQIVKEYNELKQDPEHKKMRLRFNYLHNMMTHIRQLVNEYDKHCFGPEERSNESRDIDSQHY